MSPTHSCMLNLSLSDQVMQRCDGVMASGHSVDTFAIPALQPLVLNLFVRPGREGAELATQREVVLSMLLRVVEHQRVLSLLTHVLDCFSRSAQHWHRVSCPMTTPTDHTHCISVHRLAVSERNQ